MFKLILTFIFVLNLQVLAKPAESKIKKTIQVSNTEQNLSGKEYLVKKLDYLNKSLSKNHKAKKALNLRLANVLSLIAEENFIKNEKEKCSDCLKIAKESSRRSLSIYKELDSALLQQPFLHTTALFKQAYLERFLGNKNRSLFLLKRVTEKKTIPSLFITRAWYNIGEIYFELYDYKSSLFAFNQVLKVKSNWEFKAIYRKIWSLYNLSRYQETIKELITFLSSGLYSKAKPSDQNFKQKLETELITLYSYSKLTDQNLKFLFNFNKEDQTKNTPVKRQQRLFDLAKALNRIGRLKESNKVWRLYLAKTKTIEERLMAYSFILDNDLILNYPDKLSSVGKTVEEIFILQRKTDKYKESLNLKIQKFFELVGSKKKLNSKKSKEYLLSLHQKYNSIYPVNFKILLATADLADHLGQYNLAGNLYRKSALIAKPDQEKLKENISLRQIELAELTKDDKNRLIAYNFYIEHGSKTDLIFKSKYQIAYMLYKNKEFKKAGSSFYTLALADLKTKSLATQALQIKSAHLSLSSLDKIGNQEELLVKWAGLFMDRFSKNRREFAFIYNSAVLNTVKKLVSDKDFSHRPVKASSDKDILKAWTVLNRFSVKEADKNKLSIYYLDKLLLAKELLKYEQMDESFKFLLADKNLNPEDRKVVLTWKLWLAELRFDFKEVLRLVKVLEPSNESEEYLLRLAKLSELAGLDFTPYYKTFIKNFPKSKSTPAVLTSLIDKTSLEKEKQKLLKKYFSIYKEDINQLTYLVLKLDKGQLDSNFIGFFTKQSFMKSTFLDFFEKRRKTIEDFKKVLTKISSYSLPVKASSSQLNFKLKTYTQAVNKYQEKTNALLKTQDWTARVFIVSYWKKEIERFYNSVMNLPLPKGLSQEEQIEYKTLLSKQMQDYKEEIAQLETELKKLWSQDFATDYKAGLEKDKVFYPPLKWELEKLFELAEGKHKEQVQALLSSLKSKQKDEELKRKVSQVDTETLSSLYKILRKNPFDKQSLTELLSLERKRDNSALSFYLADRIEELKSKRGRESL